MEPKVLNFLAVTHTYGKYVGTYNNMYIYYYGVNNAGWISPQSRFNP